MKEALKKANGKLQIEVWKAIVKAILCIVAMLCTIFGATYLFNVGGLVIKLLSLTVGAAFVFCGMGSMIKQAEKVKHFNKLLKVRNTLWYRRTLLQERRIK